MADNTMTIQRIIEIHAERSTDTVRDLKKEINDLKDALLNVDDASEEYDKGLKLLREDQKRLNDVNALTKKTVDALPGSYYALNAQLVQTRKNYKELTPAERENAEVGGVMLQQIRKLDAQLKQMDADMGIYHRNVGNYKSAWEGAYREVKGIKVLLAAFFAAALKGGQELVRATQTLGDEWHEQWAGIKGAYEQFVTTLSSGEGWSQLIANMRAAYDNGKRFARMLDEIFERNNALKIAEAEYSEEIEKNRIAARNTALSNEERLAAAEAAIQAEYKLADLRRSVAEQELEANRGLLQEKTKLNTEELDAYINKYEDNRDLILQAQDYLRLQREIQAAAKSGQILPPETEAAKELKQKRARLREINAGMTDELREFIVIAKKYNKSSDESVTNYVESYIKWKSVDAEFQRANARTLLTRERMLAEIAGEEQKAAEQSSKVVREKWMTDNEYYLLMLKNRAALTEEGSVEQLEALKAVREQEYVIEAERLTQTIQDEQKRADALKLIEDVKNHDLLAMEAQFYDEQQKLRDQQAEKERKDAEQRAKEEEKRRKEELAKEERLKKAKIATVENGFNTMLDLYEAFGGESAKQSEGYKAIASAQALVQAYLSANEAYAAMASIPLVGPKLGAVAAAAALAAGLAQVRQINATNMKSPAAPSAATPAPVSVSAPAVIQQVESTRTLTGVEEEQRMNNAQRVYLVYDDVQQAGKKVSVEQSESTF